MRHIKKLFDIQSKVIGHCLQSHCFQHAAALAFFNVLALLPMTVLTISVLSVTPWAASVGLSLKTWISQHLLVSSAKDVELIMMQLLSAVGTLSPQGAILMMVSAVMMFSNLEAVFNAIWRVHVGRHTLIGIIIYALSMLLIPLVITFLFMIKSQGLYWLEFFDLHLSMDHHIAMFLQSSAWLSAIIFAMMYTLVPCTRVAFGKALISGVVATILFWVVKNGFVFYFDHFTAYPLVYGALAILPAFLLWLYCVWFVVLYGAAHTYVLTILDGD